MWHIYVLYKTIKHVCSDTHTITQHHTAVVHTWHGVLRCTSLYFNALPRRNGCETPSYQIHKTRDFPSACCITACILWIFSRNFNVHFTCLYQVITSLKMHTPRLQLFFCLRTQSHRWRARTHTHTLPTVKKQQKHVVTVEAPSILLVHFCYLYSAICLAPWL